MWCEGYTAKYKRLYGKPSRTTVLKSGVEVRLDDIPGLFTDDLAVSAIQFFMRWQTMGFPYGPWGDNPNRLVQVVDILEPLDKIYHPKQTLGV